MSIEDLRRGFLTPDARYFDVDMAFYRERLEGFLPKRIVDIHGHVSMRDAYDDLSKLDWVGRITNGRGLRIEEYLDWTIKMFPGKDMRVLVFGHPTPDRIDPDNAYLVDVMDRYPADRVEGLLLQSPYWSVEELDRRFKAGRFVGIKPYPLMPHKTPVAQVRIREMLPEAHMRWADERGLIVMVHVPRGDGRLADAQNIEDLEWINREFPNARTIVAHVGREYVDRPEGREAVRRIAACENLLWDFSATDCQPMFEALIESAGPQRIMYGSDLPIIAFRGKRISRDGEYFNVVYQADWQDKRSGRVEADEGKMTFYLYEEIDAFRRAAEACRLTRADIEDVFCNNAERLLASVKESGSVAKI